MYIYGVQHDMMYISICVYIYLYIYIKIIVERLKLLTISITSLLCYFYIAFQKPQISSLISWKYNVVLIMVIIGQTHC